MLTRIPSSSSKNLNPNHHEKEIIFRVFHDAAAPDTFFLGMQRKRKPQRPVLFH